jgi:mitofusin
MSMVGFSPDCGFVFESKGPPDFSPSEYGHLVGAKTEVYNGRVRHAILALAIALFLQLGFLIKQMKDTASPSTRNRVSFYAVAMCCIGDGLGFLAFVFLPHYVGAAELVFYAVSFLFCFSAFLELRFLMEIWTVQATERMRQDRERAANSPPATTRPSGTPVPAQSSPPMPETGGLPLPVTAARPAAPTPVIIAPDQDDPDEATTPPPAGNTTATAPSRADYGALYSRYCFLLFVLFFVTLQFLTVRATVRAFYFNTLCFVYLSFWCPQIYRNVMRNCRKALRWDFVLGQSAARMLPIIYFYAVPDNILFSRNDMRALLVLAGWVWVQIVALASQELLGPRFFIREGWAPPAYDYHPILREDEEGATMPIGSSQSADDDDSASMSKAGEAKHKGKKVFDCSICATDIEVSVIPSGESSENAPGLSGMILQRRAYMVTPCRHIFHTPCLEGWMRYRLQCPNCREILPPL